MNSSTYRNIVRILERWTTLDSNKTVWDFGEHLRKEVGRAFSVTNSKELNLQKWDRIVDSLSNITSDTYRKKFKVSKPSSSTGLTAENCEEVFKPEFLDLLEEEKISNKLKN